MTQPATQRSDPPSTAALDLTLRALRECQRARLNLIGDLRAPTIGTTLTNLDTACDVLVELVRTLEGRDA